MKLPMEYYVSPLSSKVDWCEPNYVVSSNIAEFWNTISSIPILTIPPILMCLYNDYAKQVSSCKYLHFVWLLIMIVGLGSILFHSTLSLLGQFIDEISIAWVCCGFLALWLPNMHLPLWLQKDRLRFQLYLLGLSIFVTCLCALKPEVNNFALMVFVFPAFGYLKLSYDNLHCSTFRKVCWKAVFVWIVALLCWGLDRFFCPVWQAVHFPYLHGFWHILVIIGACDASACYAYFFAVEQTTKNTPQLSYCKFFNYLPFGVWYVSFDKKNTN